MVIGGLYPFRPLKPSPRLQASSKAVAWVLQAEVSAFAVGNDTMLGSHFSHPSVKVKLPSLGLRELTQDFRDTPRMFFGVAWVHLPRPEWVSPLLCTNLEPSAQLLHPSN